MNVDLMKVLHAVWPNILANVVWYIIKFESEVCKVCVLKFVLYAKVRFVILYVFLFPLSAQLGALETLILEFYIVHSTT